MASITITVPDALAPKVMEAIRAHMGDRVKGLTDSAVARLFLSEAVQRVYVPYWAGRQAKTVLDTGNAAVDAARAAEKAAQDKLKTDLDTVAAQVKTEAAGVR